MAAALVALAALPPSVLLLTTPAPPATFVTPGDKSWVRDGVRDGVGVGDGVRGFGMGLG